MTKRWKPTRKQILLTNTVFEGDVDTARVLIEQGVRHERLMGILLLGWCGGSKGWQSLKEVADSRCRLRGMLDVLVQAGYSDEEAPGSAAEQEVAELLDDVRRKHAAEVFANRMGLALKLGTSTCRIRM